MPPSAVFFVTLIACAAIAIRRRQSMIVTVGGSLVAATMATALLGRPDAQPTMPEAQVSRVDAALVRSDDFGIYREAFSTATRRLIERGNCALSDFEAAGGWARSSTHARDDVYFVFCGGAHASNRIYLKPQTGEVFR